MFTIMACFTFARYHAIFSRYEPNAVPAFTVALAAGFAIRRAVAICGVGVIGRVLAVQHFD